MSEAETRLWNMSISANECFYKAGMMPPIISNLATMTRFRFDQFSKQYLEELLSPFGEVAVGQEVLGESREVDVWFTPNPQGQIDAQALGLLGRLAGAICLFEPYRNQPTPTEVRDCLLKLFLTQAQLQRQSRRNDARLREDDLPRLWILATSASETLLSGFKAEPVGDWPVGIYFLGDFLRTAIVAINQLPCTPETLWLRILGKGATQDKAIAELIAMPQDDGLRSTTLEMLWSWRIIIETDGNDLDEDLQELIMQLSPTFLKFQEEASQAGEAKAKTEIAINLLKAGMNDEQVVQLTGLSMEVVQKLGRDVIQT